MTSTSRGSGFVQTTIRSIDAAAKRVDDRRGDLDGDIMVVALGADLDPAATPGLVEGGHEFYTVAGAFALRDVLAASRAATSSWASPPRRSNVRRRRARPHSCCTTTCSSPRDS